jgi:CelD/BcsL family acetyltransferase involved in cellulose biosynthesis
MQLAGLAAREHVWKRTHIVELNGSWAAYLASRSSKFRNNLRRSRNRAARLHDVTFERVRPRGAALGDGDPRWSAFDECRELAARSWQATSQDGTTLTHETVRSFFRDTHQLAARAGVVDMNLLRAGGQLVAFTYNYVFGGRICGLRTGYDPRYTCIRPGSLLLARSLEDSFRRGDLQLDLGVDHAQYKRQWSTRTLPSYRYTHYAPTSPRSQLLRLKHHLWARADEPSAR